MNKSEAKEIKKELLKPVEKKPKKEVVIPKTKAELEGTRYFMFKKTFEAMGIPEAWSPGKKKQPLIDDAWKLYETKQRLKGDGLTEEEIGKKIEVEKAKALDLLAKAEADRLKAIEVNEEEVKKAIEASKYVPTKEDYLKNLDRINLNLNGAGYEQTKLLLVKKEEIEAILKKMD